MQRPLGLAPFDNQTRLEHALTVCGGVAVCLLAYFATVWVVYGDLSVVALEEAVTPQRVGGVAAAVAVWAYFGVAFIKGYGGPVLNTIVYPLPIAVLGPFPARWLLFGPDLSGLQSRFVGLFIFEPVLTTGLLAFVGLSVFSTILMVWAAVIGDDAREQWEREQLTAEFYEEFVDVE